MKRVNSTRYRRNGFAVLELATWCAVLLPVTLLGFSYGTFFHNDSSMRRIPSTVLRETVGRVSQWSSDGSAGLMVADIGRLREMINDIARRAARETLAMTYGLNETSATACFWVLNVDPLSGSVVSDQARECVQVGPLSLRASLETREREFSASRIGVPLGMAVSVESYAHQVVLVGVEIAGLFQGVSEWSGALTIQHGKVKRLREEVEL
jgi:hypothetical protein